MGAAWDFHKHIGVRIEWERYLVADGIGDQGEVNLRTVGFRVKF